MKRILCLLAATAALACGQEKGKVFAPGARGNIELSVYLISGLAPPPPNTNAAKEPPKDDVPPDLASTVQQFHSIFMYRAYKLVDEFTLRSRNLGGAEVGGELSYFAGGQYNFKYARARVAPGEHVVHIDGLRLEITRRPTGLPSAPEKAPVTVVLVSTDLDVPDGQKTVVGKSAVNNDAWFLVVVPKIIP
jgi:hypothetical protein